MRKTIFTLALVMITLCLSANKGKEVKKVKNTVVTGIIVDEKNGEELTGVCVKLDGQTAYTDFDGEFRFENVQPGEYVIRTKYVSYEDKEIKLELNNKEKIEISLKSK